MFGIENVEFFVLIIFVVALLYSSVGHGGASGYLAVMALFSISPENLKPTALLLNICVSSVAFYHYYKTGYFNFKLFIQFAVTSIPFSFLGGFIEANTTLYKNILAILLLFAILKILKIFGESTRPIKVLKPWQGLFLGGCIGFFSGLIGIGGGIILTPAILLFNWGKMKQAAAVSALFIWVNSVSGLGGQLTKGIDFSNNMLILVAVAFLGGFIGS